MTPIELDKVASTENIEWTKAYKRHIEGIESIEGIVWRFKGVAADELLYTPSFWRNNCYSHCSKSI